ncbi:NAD-dependent deacylase [Deinococcus sp. KNUC1210]|uniref:SIR2 family NAD-dependent protein deacylase n=1 Tax=Deinococcus sp. KNUC1210 TaxID=2917691 RepID=UPI001EF113E4|nr:NAD-dependent deacylase [Deinococcus sp. KNUC1210]ULH14483.1 NAD-dependent deacylase [Deinococcus sp. KNUC1210]
MNLAEARSTLQAARRVVVLTGAGISAESGIPTFRDAQTGHWARFRPEDLASPDAYHRDPELVWEWYAGRFRDVMQAQPNRGHLLLAELERQKRAEGGSDAFTLVTQNVDGLHQRAGSAAPLELHGTLLSARCEACGHVQPLPDAATFTPPPKCEVCGHRMRPHIVWFGEFLPDDVLALAELQFKRADVALIIGTSSLVYPAAGLADRTRSHGGLVFEINPDETPLTQRASFSLRATASEGLTRLMEARDA